MNLQYKILNRGKLELTLNDKKMIIHGEALATRTAFNVYFQSIKNWEPPYDTEEISDGEKYRILRALILESRKKENVDLFFD